MLGPAALSVSQQKVALKPAAGYEQQLWTTTAQYAEPGVLTINGPSSGVYNSNVADTNGLAVVPSELVAILDGEVNSASVITVTVTGTDQFGAAFTGIGTFSPPSWAQTQENVFPRGFAVDLTPQGNAGQKCATIATCSAVCAGDVAPLNIKVVAIPSFTTVRAQAGAYRLIGTKMKLDYNMGVPDPHAVQDGRDKSKFVKPGEIPEKTVMITQKVGSFGDGLMRINGIRVTGVVVEKKEDSVETMRIYLPGLIITAEPSTGQSVEDVEATGKGLCERVAVLIAH